MPKVRACVCASYDFSVTSKIKIIKEIRKKLPAFSSLNIHKNKKESLLDLEYDQLKIVMIKTNSHNKKLGLFS